MCVEKIVLRRLGDEIDDLPAWHDVEGIERVCDVIAAAVIEGLAVPDAVEITSYCNVRRLVWE